MQEFYLDEDDELGAVNDMLSAIGESPVSSLSGGPNADITNCRRMLAKVNSEVQAKGWTFNIEEGTTLTPDTFSKLIEYLPIYLRITTAGGTVYTNRGGYIYDRTVKTDKFDGPITVDMISLKSFAEMPTCFRTYIVAKAARRFNIRFFGAAEIEQSLAQEEAEAWAECQTYELDYGAYNMAEGDAFVGGQLSRG